MKKESKKAGQRLVEKNRENDCAPEAAKTTCPSPGIFYSHQSNKEEPRIICDDYRRSIVVRSTLATVA